MMNDDNMVEEDNVDGEEVHPRIDGKDCNDRILEEKIITALNQLYEILTLLQFYPFEAEEEYCMIMIVLLIAELAEINAPYLSLDKIERKHKYLDDFTDEEALSLTKFSKSDIRDMINHLNMPANFVINENHPDKKYNFPSEPAFIICLIRFAGHGNTLWQMQHLVNADSSTISKVFNVCVEWLDTNHGFRLRRIEWFQNRFEEYNQTFIEEIKKSLHPNEAMPDVAKNICCFIDTARISISKPNADDVQRVKINNKLGNYLSIQFIMGMDGMFIDLFGDVFRRHNDMLFLTVSESNEMLANCQTNLTRQFFAYGDKGYIMRSHVKGAFQVPTILTAAMVRCNELLSPKRVFAKEGFSKVKERCPLLNCPFLMKMQMSPVLRYLRVAFLLTNMHTCLHGSHNFVRPPTLAEYMA